MAFSAKAVVAVLVFMALAICSCSAGAVAEVDVLPLRIDNPAPDGSGVVFFQLQAATAGASFTNFKIISTSISGSQTLKLWNANAGTCDGTTLSADGLVPTNGKVCFWGTVGAEGESSFTYAAVDADGTPLGASKQVVIVNYNVQTCPGIPDLGPSGFATTPASPEVSITLDQLEIHFEVTASYLRNQSAWFIDFFDFDNNADSADGSGRTCSNHDSSAFTDVSFPQWWQSQPRATFTSSLVGSPVAPALNGPTFFPMYKDSAKWTIEAAGCDKVKYRATIPTVNLISNSNSDCKRNGQPNPAATANGLNYTATLYVAALRPRDINDKTKGYHQVTYTYPFSFRIQQTVTDIRTTSSAFAFQVSVDNMRVTRGQGLTLSVETIISDPNSANTPNLNNFQLASYPHQAGHTVAPTLERVSDNSHCPDTQHAPCAILWRATINELTLAQLDNDMDAYNRQFVGAYTLQWNALSTPNLPLQAQLIIDAVAANSTDLGQLAVQSKVNFFRSQNDMVDTGNIDGLLSPTFSSGEKIWVRHSFLVDSKDVSAYLFTLQRAWVCWSPVAGFVPTINPGAGCAQDVPGVMEAALGHRFLLYNVSVGGIADTDVPAGSTQKSRVWGWTLVQPTSSSWTGGQTVHSGFGINALPLVSDAQPHTYYFHLVSQVSQAPLPNSNKRAARATTEEGLFMFKRAGGVDTSSGAGMSAVTVVNEQSASPASQLSAGWATQLVF